MFLDATYVKAHEGARVVSKAIVVATGVAADGDREVLGLAVGDSEDSAFWTSFLRSLRARGLGGVRLVISDAHEGLTGVDRQGHARRRLATLPRALPAQRAGRSPQGLRRDGRRRHPHDLRSARRRRGRRPARLDRREARPPVPRRRRPCSRDAAVDICAFTAFPHAHWRKIWSTNPLERVNKEIKRRTNVVGIFPNEAAVLRLAGSPCCSRSTTSGKSPTAATSSEGSMAKLYEIDNDDDNTKEVGPRTNELLAG